MQTTNDFALRRSFQPYLGEAIIFGALSVLLVFAWMRTSNTSWLVAIIVLLVIVLASHYADFRYRVFWRNGVIERVTSNGIHTTIRIADISRITLEKSESSAMLTLRRPMRRVTIYAMNGDHLDVSLRHFVVEDIRKMLQDIHKNRSDLTLPTI
jgi:hypothetical protein